MNIDINTNATVRTAGREVSTSGTYVQQTLQERAREAYQKQLREEAIGEKMRQKERYAEAERLIGCLLGYTVQVSHLPVEIDNLYFDMASFEDNHWLVLLRDCPSGCGGTTKDRVDSLAELGELLDRQPDYCAKCSG